MAARGNSQKNIADQGSGNPSPSMDCGTVTDLFGGGVPLAALLDEIPLGLVVLDRERRIRLVNRVFEVLTGFSRSEALGVPCRFIMRTDLCQRSCPALEAARHGGSVTRQGNIITRQRRKVSIRLTTGAITDARGDLVGFMETVEDIHLRQPASDRGRSELGFGPILGRSAKMDELYRLLPVVAQTDSSVLITGETGTGKDLVAESIHDNSARAQGPFIKINCGALPETLLESELFGHTKGAFTGAVSDKAGRLRLAHNGTVFLTEIGDLPLSLQVKLLTFLDDKMVYPLGSAKAFQADVRVIAATHRHLEQMVKDGRFREDLLFRLNVVRLHLPPLRERTGDTELLLDHFLKMFTARFNKKIKGIADPARRVLLAYRYPGNIRELRNIVEYASNICPDHELIQVDHLPSYVVQAPEPAAEREAGPSVDVGAGASGDGSGALNWAGIERRLILDALTRAKGRRSKAAEILGWGRSTLWRKMKQYDLDG